MKKVILFILFISSSVIMMGQATNYSLLNNNGLGYIETSPIVDLNNSTEATFQLWIKPTQAQNNAKLFAQDNFSIELNGSSLSINTGNISAVSTKAFNPNEWYQITITASNGVAKIYINNEMQNVNGNINSAFASAITSLKIGEGFVGELDEIRIWQIALEQKDFFWQNTLNKFNPNYDKLIAYWKGDQNLCENLVDYKFKHHGVFNNITRKEVTDNNKFKYRIVSGYTNFIRFIDRPNINRDMFLMTNDVILLAAKIQTDGSIKMEYADNSGTPTNVNYLETFDGRKGIMDFQGRGSQLFIEEGEVAYSSDSRFGRGTSAIATFQGWVYIDSWQEGAKIFSQYKDQNNCLELYLDKEENKAITANLCGWKATLTNTVEVGKWQYISVYFAPKNTLISSRNAASVLTIGVDGTVYNSSANKTIMTLNGDDLVNNELTITAIPIYSNTPVYLGKDFDGKMDEVQVWGSDRSGSVKGDSENEYQVNSGNWNNLFLTAYWKGDNPENIGKDSQGYIGITDYMRGFYENYRGMKFRISVIYPDGEGWKNILNQQVYADRFIADCKKYIQHFDGLDVDLEWYNYNVLNPILRRMINEVIAPNPEKIFSISQHGVSYSLASDIINNPHVKFFTMQLYGPSNTEYQYSWFQNMYNNFKNHGYPDSKLALSYGNLIVENRSEEGYKDLFEKYGYTDETFNPDWNSWNYGSGTKTFSGATQVKNRQQLIINNNCAGTMYFDMGNDLKVSDHKSLIRAQNDVLASNVDTIITKVVLPTGIKQNTVDNTAKNFSVTKGTNNSFKITLNDVSLLKDQPVCTIYSINGQIENQFTITEKETTINNTGIAGNVYVVNITFKGKTESIKVIN